MIRLGRVFCHYVTSRRMKRRPVGVYLSKWCVFVSIYVDTRHVQRHVYIHIHTYIDTYSVYVCICIYIYVCVYAYVYAYVCVYVNSIVIFYL